MKRGGIINAQLAYSLARLGHTDRLVVCDAGLPIPPGPEVVDLAFQYGVPPLEVVLRGLMDELLVEGATAAEEAKKHSPDLYEHLHALLPNLELVSHQELKRMTAGARLVVRTGGATAYSNVILHCGVPF